MTCEFEAGALRVRLSGEIDHHSSADLRQKIDRALFGYSPHTVILCLDGVEFMDSAGLGLILGRYTRVKDYGGVLKLEHPSPQIEKILSMAGVDRLIEIIRAPAPQKKLKRGGCGK